MRDVEFSILKGKTITAIEGMEPHSETVYFRCEDGTRYKMFHLQDCCETVDLEDVFGDPESLIGSPVTMAEESVDSGENGLCDSYTWTFYKLATLKGYVTLRWHGRSNGYYSESVQFFELDEAEDRNSRKIDW